MSEREGREERRRKKKEKGKRNLAIRCLGETNS